MISCAGIYRFKVTHQEDNSCLVLQDFQALGTVALIDVVSALSSTAAPRCGTRDVLGTFGLGGQAESEDDHGDGGEEFHVCSFG
jgi:hypothetical protein